MRLFPESYYKNHCGFLCPHHHIIIGIIVIGAGIGAVYLTSKGAAKLGEMTLK